MANLSGMFVGVRCGQKTDYFKMPASLDKAFGQGAIGW